ncbi:MAG: hypothetical protein ISS36_00695 [Candidatus Aenigmarchaeota archaeon]|nr:hypothetical protein [Candidatus Aenigmarchaeota archaeon]
MEEERRSEERADAYEELGEVAVPTPETAPEPTGGITIRFTRGNVVSALIGALICFGVMYLISEGNDRRQVDEITELREVGLKLHTLAQKAFDKCRDIEGYERATLKVPAILAKGQKVETAPKPKPRQVEPEPQPEPVYDDPEPEVVEPEPVTTNDDPRTEDPPPIANDEFEDGGDEGGE